MSSRGKRHKFQGIAVVWSLQHVEGFAEGQVPEDIHGQVVTPVGHVLGDCPALAALTRAEADLFAKRPHVRQDIALHVFYGRVGEGLRQNAALAGVHILVASVVGVGNGVGKGIVKLGLTHIGLEAVDILEGGIGVE